MKRRQALLLATLTAATMLSSGCASMIDSVVNPYEAKTACPNFDKGECTSVENAYKKAISGQPGTELGLPLEEGVAGSKGNSVAAPSETEYQKALYGKYARLLKQPEAPVLVPAQVMRILLLPYEGDGSELYSSRFVYIKVDDSKWLLGDGITADNE